METPLATENKVTKLGNTHLNPENHNEVLHARDRPDCVKRKTQISVGATISVVKLLGRREPCCSPKLKPTF